MRLLGRQHRIRLWCLCELRSKHTTTHVPTISQLISCFRSFPGIHLDSPVEVTNDPLQASCTVDLEVLLERHAMTMYCFWPICTLKSATSGPATIFQMIQGHSTTDPTHVGRGTQTRTTASYVWSLPLVPAFARWKPAGVGRK